MPYIVEKPSNDRELYLQDKYLSRPPPDKPQYSQDSDKKYSSSYYGSESPISYNKEPLVLNRPNPTQTIDLRPESPTPNEYKSSYSTRSPIQDERTYSSYDQGISHEKISSLNRDKSYEFSREPSRIQTNAVYETTTPSVFKTTAENNKTTSPAIDQSAIEAIFGKNPEPNYQSPHLINNGRGVPLVNDQYIDSNSNKKSTRPLQHRFQVVPVTPES
ncbi:hypothetical protein O0L34_g8923 [Tuta absoluta]|nr:hypothetical protein O0L34_g8923 [Tuta absoluta]